MSTASNALARNRLGVPSVASFALTAAAPLMVVGGYVTTAWTVTGTIAVSFALIAMAAVLVVFCMGYVTMARYVSNAGSLYTYVAHGLGPQLAVAAAAAQILAYTLLQVGLYGIAGAQTQAVMSDLLGVSAPWWFWALLAWAVVAFLGTRGVGVSSTLLAVAVVAELVIVGVVAAVNFSHPANGHVSFTALDPRQLDGSTLGVAFAIAITAFVGVEAAPVYSEESRRPRSTVMIATFSALGLMLVTYVLGSWSMTVAVGADGVVAAAGELGPDMLFVPPSQYLGGDLLIDLGHVLLLTSIAAGLLAYHNAVARCVFALGRERVLPAACGRTNPRTSSPIVASLAQSVVGLAVVVVYASMGWDPMTRLFYCLGTTGALGILILLTLASASVIGFFSRTGIRETRWLTTVAPLVATVSLATCLFLVVTNYAALLGVDSGSAERWLFPASYALAGGLGWAYALFLKRRRPRVLSVVGHGANAALAQTHTADNASFQVTR